MPGPGRFSVVGVSDNLSWLWRKQRIESSSLSIDCNPDLGEMPKQHFSSFIIAVDDRKFLKQLFLFHSGIFWHIGIKFVTLRHFPTSVFSFVCIEKVKTLFLFIFSSIRAISVIGCLRWAGKRAEFCLSEKCMKIFYFSISSTALIKIEGWIFPESGLPLKLGEGISIHYCFLHSHGYP